MFKNNKNFYFTESSIFKLNDKTKKNDGNQNDLIKPNEEVIDSIINFYDNDIEKIEQKLSEMKNQEFFIRENQISHPVDEIIKVPKKIIKDEAKIISEDKMEKRKKNQVYKIEKEKDNIKRKMEMEINSKKIKRFNDKIKNIKQKIKNKNKKFLCIYITIIIVITVLIIILIILLDKYLK